MTKLPGQPCGAGLTSEAADALGLKAGLPVAVSIADARAGTLGNNGTVRFLRVARDSAVVKGHATRCQLKKITVDS